MAGDGGGGRSMGRFCGSSICSFTAKGNMVAKPASSGCKGADGQRGSTAKLRLAATGRRARRVALRDRKAAFGGVVSLLVILACVAVVADVGGAELVVRHVGGRGFHRASRADQAKAVELSATEPMPRYSHGSTVVSLDTASDSYCVNAALVIVFGYNNLERPDWRDDVWVWSEAIGEGGGWVPALPEVGQELPDARYGHSLGACVFACINQA